MAKPALGRGLGALLGGAAPSKSAPMIPLSSTSDRPSAPGTGGGRVMRLALDQIRPCAFQPRKAFTEETLRELADSIRAQGIVQPLVVRTVGDHYELIAGERRWRAAQLAGLTEAPVVLRAADDAQVLELALIENLQRENLNPMEEAQGYKQLLDQFNLRQEDVAAKVGKSRVAVANALRLLNLAVELQTWVRQGQLSVGHAKALLGLPTAGDQKLAAAKVVKDGLNVRQTEQLVTAWPKASAPSVVPARGPNAGARDVHVAALENRLQERFGTKVGLRYREGKGSIEVRFYTDADLDRVLGILGVNMD